MKMMVVMLMLVASPVMAQSSSLYVTQPTEAVLPMAPRPNMPGNPISPAIARSSFSAVIVGEPRTFGVHDLITIIVRESTESESEAKFDSRKESKYNGEIAAFPNFNLSDLLEFQLGPSSMSRGKPRVDIQMKKDFKADGEASRSDTFTSRITARIIDVKPNGTLTIEARKFIQHDSEKLEMVLTDTCRKDDVKADNTVLSTQLYDLHLVKKTSGDLRRSTKKGWLTKVLDGIFAF